MAKVGAKEVVSHFRYYEHIQYCMQLVIEKAPSPWLLIIVGVV